MGSAPAVRTFPTTPTICRSDRMAMSSGCGQETMIRLSPTASRPPKYSRASASLMTTTGEPSSRSSSPRGLPGKNGDAHGTEIVWQQGASGRGQLVSGLPLFRTKRPPQVRLDPEKFFFRSEGEAAAWCTRSHVELGFVMPFATAWKLGKLVSRSPRPRLETEDPRSDASHFRRPWTHRRVLECPLVFRVSSAEDELKT